LIRAVIFDLGGVLVRTEDPSPRQRLADRLNLSYAELSSLVFDSDSSIQATLGKISTQAHWEAIRLALNLAPEELSSVPEHFWGGDRLDTVLVDYLRSLRPRYRTALLSNAWDDLRPYLVNYWKIADAFDELIISAEVGLAKPDANIYRLAVERLGAAPEEAVFVDDFPANVVGAQAAGLHAIQFRNREQALAELEALLDAAGGEPADGNQPVDDSQPAGGS
jgi:epoxide hydrolase-like predicted phosphatase